MGGYQCPASMCPLIAPDGSPWTGRYGAPCPGHEDLSDGGCPWWSMACSTGGVQHEVELAAANGGAAAVLGPNKPRRLAGSSRTYECPKMSICRWQQQAELAGRDLCPPRDALRRGIDPRVTLF